MQTSPEPSVMPAFPVHFVALIGFTSAAWALPAREKPVITAAAITTAYFRTTPPSRLGNEITMIMEAKKENHDHSFQVTRLAEIGISLIWLLCEMMLIAVAEKVVLY
ncbi:hypothetical protein [Streptomyces sp. MMS24-I29]|uniref:hypothetical protein n=1 Tax=Streptomyces sp. MMS24-I29 TaxID=3351480 RepID=UPI003C79C837